MGRKLFPLMVVLAFLVCLPTIVQAQERSKVKRQVAAGEIYTVAIKSNGTLWAWGVNPDGALGTGQQIEHIPVRAGTGLDWISVSVYGDYTVALKADGTLWAWGNNDNGQLGNGTNGADKYSYIPVQIGSDTDWVSVDAGWRHAVALKADGTLWAWGLGYFGQLGDGTGLDRNSPVQVGMDTDWVSVSAGADHTVALKADGTIWAWGYDDYGQLGNGYASPAYRIFIPMRFSPDTDWISVSAGGSQTVALKADGTIWAWGNNNWGQLGDGTNIDRYIPTKIGSDTDWVSIAAEYGYTVALKANGTLWAWGRNDYGQLGNGTTTDSNTPVQVGSDIDWVSFGAGRDHMVALKADGTLWAWGRNNYHQLGDGTTLNSSIPILIYSDYVSRTQIAPAYYNTEALDSDGTLWAWGDNNVGQLGNGTTTSSNIPIRVGSDVNWVSVAKGLGTTIGLKANGTLWACGTNYYGELGDGTNTTRYLLSKIGSDTDWIYVDRGTKHTLALKANGTLWAWGAGYYGQLGNGTNTGSNIPIQIGSDNHWVSVAGGFEHTVALKADGTLWAWGYNEHYGQVGDGTNTNSNIPIHIGSDNHWVSVAAGRYFTVALKADGTLWAWGENSYGHLGNGTNTGSNIPIQIGSDTDWVSVAAGNCHTVALKADGTLWTWGCNLDGQLGNGTNTGSKIPIQIGSDTDWVSVEAGADHTAALKADGTLWTWGINGAGQLGDGTNTNSNIPIQIGNNSPIFDPIGWQVLGEGSTLTLSVNAIDLNGNTLTYSATGLPPGASFSGTTFTWTPGYDQAGYHYVTVSVSDGSLSDLTEIRILVNDVVGPDTTPPVVNVPADITMGATDSSGATVDFNVTAVDDVDGSITASCNYGTGSIFPIGTTVVECTATDSTGNIGTASFNVTVQDTPPVLTLPGDIIAQAPDETGTTVDYIGAVTAVDSVDGSLTPSCAPPSGSNFELGATTVTCSVTDSWGNTESGEFHIIVSTNSYRGGGGTIPKGTGGTIITPDGSVTIEIPPGALSEDTYLSIAETGTSFELTSNAGNGTSVFGVVIQPEGTTFNSPITITFTWTDNNNPGTIDDTNIKEDNVRVIKDGVALTSQCKNEPGPVGTTGAECNTAENYFKFQVNSLSEFVLAYFDWYAPEIMDMSANPLATVAIGTPITITATVTDIGTGYTPIGSVECVIDNDPGTEFEMDPADGDFDSVTEVATGPIGFFEEAGVHRVCVKGWDKHENVESPEKCMLIAVYDPSAGFVTGGGWINSPAGAYVPDTSLAGKATFGFVSKYKKGATEPTGQTEFQFETADLNFHSSSYEWLVVTGVGSANFKGSGTINDEGDYKFKLWAGDGDSDTFRIRIWEEDEDTAVETDIYDNGFNQEIGGGSIVIHTK